MVRPYILSVEKPWEILLTRKSKFVSVSGFPYSSDTSFKVGFSTILSIAAPDPGLVEAYVNTVAQAEMAEQAATTTQVEQLSADTGFVPSDAETAQV